MSDAIAHGSLVLTLDAQQLNAGLKKTARDAKQAGATVGQNFKTSALEMLKDPLGGDKGILGMGGKAGAIGAVIAAVGMIGSKIAEASPIAREFRWEVDQQTQAAKEWGDQFRESIGDIKERLAGISDIAGTQKGLASYKDSIEDLNARLKSAEATQRKAFDAAEDMASIWSGSLSSIGHWLAPGTSREGQHSILSARLEQAKGNTEEAKKALEEARKAYDRLMNPETNPAAINALRQFVQEQEDAIAALKGRTAEEQKLISLQRMYNLSRKQMDEAKAASDALQHAKSQAELAKATQDAAGWMRELQEEAGLVAKRSADEAKLEEFVKKGIDGEQIARLKELIALKKKQNAEYKPLTALEKGTAAEISFQNRDRFNQQKNAEAKAQAELLKQNVGWLGRIFAELQKSNNKEMPEI